MCEYLFVFAIMGLSVNQGSFKMLNDIFKLNFPYLSLFFPTYVIFFKLYTTFLLFFTITNRKKNILLFFPHRDKQKNFPNIYFFPNLTKKEKKIRKEQKTHKIKKKEKNNIITHKHKLYIISIDFCHGKHQMRCRW